LEADGSDGSEWKEQESGGEICRSSGSARQSRLQSKIISVTCTPDAGAPIQPWSADLCRTGICRLCEILKIGMAKHPNTHELERIRLTQRVLTAVALATVILIGVLAMHGSFHKPAASETIVKQQQH
jgi:hypothetical protein